MVIKILEFCQSFQGLKNGRMKVIHPHRMVAMLSNLQQ